MIADVTTALTNILNAVGDFLTPTAGSEGSLITAASVAAIGTLFAIPIAVKVGKKAIGLIKSI